MVGKKATLEKGFVPVASKPLSNWMHIAATVLTGIAIISSAFHFWPFESSKMWQMLNPLNMAVLVWSLVLISCYLKRLRLPSTFLLPHLSVFAYLSINILSIAFTSDPSRATIFTIKLVLILVFGYTLLSSAIYDTRSLKIVYGLATMAVTMSVAYCIVVRFGFGSDNFGFYDNAYKYGTYIGTLAPLCGAYLFTSPRSFKKVVGAALVIGALVSSGSLGAVAAIFAGMITLAIIVPRWSLRLFVAVGLLCGIGFVILLGSNPAVAILKDDITLAEKDNINLKQRYIEWQAEINLLEERSITGTAAGCINEYRSSFYYRLPKLNTLNVFDQNGWLAIGAETGILGLVCFCWIIVYYFKLAFLQVTAVNQKELASTHRFAIANLAGLIATCIANLFSSVHYNGILIAFVLVLVLVSKTNWLSGGR